MDRLWSAPGFSVGDLGELFGIELEDVEVDSVGGLVAKHLGRLADEGDVVTVQGIELTALSTQRRRKRLVSVGARMLQDGAGDELGEPNGQ